ncbi:MAG: hypothetical protein HWQ38_27445 [Nostoc sp. NMS7]|uniref:hypothetical protein n=1 Tax=Nostoc sp. NMS7 TaxID=2815391 RepID=UPI0025E1CACC|nr:hypothetical protein [Nostoc sp. NMS7]MBN3950003.1 hypothetical protein [Nostoc sp. NMS7]
MPNLRKFYLRCLRRSLSQAEVRAAPTHFLLLGIVLAIALFIYAPQPPNAKSTVSALETSQDIELAKKVGKEIIAACPIVTDVKNLAAYDSCAQKLSKLKTLRDTMNAPFLWGAQSKVGNYNIKDSQTTEFDPFVWRRIYLATFMFKGEPQIEQVNNLIVIHLPIQFRNHFDIGAYPYPFWYSSKKWDSYQQSTELLVFLEQGKLKGALRSAVVDPQRPKVNYAWDGKWIWTDAHGKQPYVTLYTRLFSPSNPHVAKVDAAYRAFEAKLRQNACVVCHSPDNASKQNPLLILSYPNQALSLRHETVRQIKEKRMPPPAGIVDDQERQQLIQLAQAFAQAGDKALAYEGEKITSGKN